MNTVTFYRGGKGLYTRVDPVRLDFDGAEGVAGLAYAVNVVIDDSYRTSRRKGFTKRNSSAYHSLYPVGNEYFLGVSGSALYAVEPDYSRASLVALDSTARMSYIQVGNDVYYSNGVDKGIITNKAYVPWVVGTYYGPDTSRSFSGPVAGHLLEYYANKVWIGYENTILCSEAFSTNLFDESRNFVQYGSRIKMIESVGTGLYVSTEKNVYYLNGSNLGDMKQTKLVQHPAVLGTGVKTSGLILQKDLKVPEQVVIWTAKDGIYLGGSDAVFGKLHFENLTEEKFDFPSAYEGCAAIIDGVYVVNLFS